MTEEITTHTCSCGGWLKSANVPVEFYGIDFGLRKAEVCGSCGSEFLDQKTLLEIEREIKKRKIFGLERKVQVTKSGNSLVIRIPPEIAAFMGIEYQSLLQLFPVEKGRLEVKVVD